MKPKIAYNYTVLRYVHDITTGEFVNVGVALFAPEARYVSALCRPTYGRLSRVFPGLNGDHFRSLMRHIQARFEELGSRLARELPLDTPKGILELAQSILPADDSSLQWSPPGGGLSENPSATLEQLFDRMVSRYDQAPQQGGRSDEDVWREFRKTLEKRRVLERFEPKKFVVQDDELEFQYAWKNGIWHCLEPISFDLTTADTIKDKAHRWLGHLASLQNAPEQFKVYMLVGRPQRPELSDAYEKALSILRKSPVASELFSEDRAEDLTSMIEREMRQHERGLN